jgi:hypothetical protein
LPVMTGCGGWWPSSTMAKSMQAFSNFSWRPQDVRQLLATLWHEQIMGPWRSKPRFTATTFHSVRTLPRAGISAPRSQRPTPRTPRTPLCAPRYHLAVYSASCSSDDDGIEMMRMTETRTLLGLLTSPSLCHLLNDTALFGLSEHVGPPTPHI